jgi:hypothetical protein
MLRALADAPVGAYPMLEAALAWLERRPTGWNRLGIGLEQALKPVSGTAPARHVTIAETDSVIAPRLARLLSTLTWVTTTPVDVAGTAAEHTRVQVPAVSYHRLTRAMTGAWRTRDRLLANTAFGAESQQAAIGLWRMAILIGGLEPQSGGGLAVRVSTRAAADTLTLAAARLGLTPSADSYRGGHTIAIARREQASRLLAQAAYLP